MTRQVEAVFEDGVLKPVEPLPFAERQRVVVTVEVPEQEQSAHRKAEMEWIGANAHRHRGQWIALQGSELLAHGPNAKAVRAEALRKGVAHPLFYHVPEDLGEPSISWF